MFETQRRTRLDKRLGRLLGCFVAALALFGGSLAQEADDTLNVLVPAEFPDIDPCQTVSGDQQMLMYHLYSRLYTFNENMEPRPDLVVRDSVSDDGTVWTFEIHPGVTFHDGTPLDAEAIKYAVDRMNARDCGQATLYSPIQEVRVDSPTQLTIVTNGKFPALRNNLAHPAAAIVSPTADMKLGDDFGIRPIGSGPYVLQDWVTGDRITVVRNDDYYGDQPYFARIDFNFVADDTTRALLIETGGADVALRTSPTDTERLRLDPDLVVAQIPGRSTFYMMNVTQSPFDDVRVRRAANYAVDKQAIVDRVLFGTGTPARSLIEAVQHTIEAGFYEYDPELARELLVEADAEGADLVLLSPDGRYPQDADVSQAVAGYLREAGFEVTLQVLSDWPSYLDRVEAQDFDMYMIGFGGSTGDPDNAFRRVLHSDYAGVLWNPGGYVNPEVDRLIEEGALEFDDVRRAEIYAEVQELVWDEAPWLFMFRASTALVHREGIEGITVLPGTEVPYFWLAYRD